MSEYNFVIPAADADKIDAALRAKTIDDSTESLISWAIESQSGGVLGVRAKIRSKNRWVPPAKIKYRGLTEPTQI